MSAETFLRFIFETFAVLCIGWCIYKQDFINEKEKEFLNNLN